MIERERERERETGTTSGNQSGLAACLLAGCHEEALTRAMIVVTNVVGLY